MNLTILHLNGYTSAQREIFQGRGGLAELGHFNKFFLKINTREKAPQGTSLSVFSLMLLKLHFGWNI